MESQSLFPVIPHAPLQFFDDSTVEKATAVFFDFHSCANRRERTKQKPEELLEIADLKGAGTVTSFDYSCIAGMYKHAHQYLNFVNSDQYIASLGRWLSRDPLDGSSYDYCANDPINCIDPLGLIAYLINHPNWVKGLGHNANIIGTGKGPYTYVSYGPKGSNSPLSQGILDYRPFPTRQDAFNYAAGLGYTRYAQYDSCNDQAALNEAKTWDQTKYKGIGHNSDDFATSVLRAHGSPIGKDLAPNGTFVNQRGFVGKPGGPSSMGDILKGGKLLPE